MKYIVATRDGRRFREAFDLERDPGETRNAIDDPALALRLRAVQRVAEDVLLDALLP